MHPANGLTVLSPSFVPGIPQAAERAEDQEGISDSHGVDINMCRGDRHSHPPTGDWVGRWWAVGSASGDWCSHEAWE